MKRFWLLLATVLILAAPLQSYAIVTLDTNSDGVLDSHDTGCLQRVATLADLMALSGNSKRQSVYVAGRETV